MDVIGLGTQIVECLRVRKLIDAHAETFLKSVYTDAELAYCRDRSHSTEFYAAFWAAKEAVFRSLGTKWKRGIPWQDVEIVCDTPVAPRAIPRCLRKSGVVFRPCPSAMFEGMEMAHRRS